MSFTEEQRDAALKRDIEHAQNSKIKLNAIIIATGCCDECMKLDGKEFSLEQVINENILPQKNCTRFNFCICCYGFKSVRDENGLPIRK